MLLTTSRSVQPTHKLTKTNQTRQVGLVLAVGGLSWVIKFLFFIFYFYFLVGWVGFGS